MGVLERVVVWFRSATSRIHAPLFWRVTYWVLDRSLTIRLGALVCRAVGRRRGQSPVRIAHLFAGLLVGWPHHLGTTWINLDVRRVRQRVQRELEPPQVVAAARSPRPLDRPERVGVLARLDTAFYFTPPFFEAIPAEQVFAFDFEAESDVARSALSPLATYSSFGAAEVDELAAAIDAADLDLLLIDVRSTALDPVLDRISTPCVAFLSVEVYVREHPRISFHLYCLQQADYLIRDNRLFCRTSGSYFSDQLLFPAWVPFHDQGLRGRDTVGWREREPLILFHGRLAKATVPYLETIFGLLADDTSLRFAFAGSDDTLMVGKRESGSLARIRDVAGRFGVEDRIEYLGPYSPFRDAAGELADPAGRMVFDYLSRARLAPDPWPTCGATTRLEAYFCGTPVAHLGIRDDPASWGRPQHAVKADHQSLAFAETTVYTPEDYRALCKRILYEPDFADAVSRAQLERADQLADPAAFWERLLECYAGWRTGEGRRVPPRYRPEPPKQKPA